MGIDKLAGSVANRYASYFTFSIGDEVYFGKYKNKRGKIRSFGTDDKGHPTVEVEVLGKGQRKTFVLKLYTIWKAPEAK
jgi:hypothetical protein